MDGVFLINKPIGWTSFDICAKLRKKFNTKRVGHSGTLDPFAEGLMVVAMGKATKILPFLEECEKTYIASLKLGSSTNTLDHTGEVIKTAEVPFLEKSILIDVLNSFLGDSYQIPPMYSALKKDGVPLYQLAREGVEIAREARPIHISHIELIGFEENVITFKARVSRGTYIRTLGYDIAKSLNTEGHLISLIRTQIGNDTLENATSIDLVKEDDCRSITSVLSHIKTIAVDDKIEYKIKNGIRLYFDSEEKLILLKNKNEIPLAIYEKREDGYYYTKRGLF